MQEQSGVTSLAWLPGRLGGRLGLRCLHLAVSAGRSPGSGVRADGPGSEGLARAKSTGPPTALG